MGVIKNQQKQIADVTARLDALTSVKTAKKQLLEIHDLIFINH